AASPTSLAPASTPTAPGTGICGCPSVTPNPPGSARASGVSPRWSSRRWSCATPSAPSRPAADPVPTTPLPTSPREPAVAELGHVVVLSGGLSYEREVSLRSGRRVAEALRSAGVEVVARDADALLLDLLAADPPDVVLPVLHGAAGEDGAIRDVL